MSHQTKNGSAVSDNDLVNGTETGCEIPLPSDARCLKCGYSLQRLTEQRCPECGLPFDSAIYREGIKPLWPQLVAIAMLGYAVADISTDLLAKMVVGFSFIHHIHDILTVVVVIVELIAAYKLWHYRNSGRLLLLVALFVQLGHAAVVWLPVIRTSSLLVLPISSSVFLLVWIVFLLTGFRRRSLASRREATPRPAKLQDCSAKRDWLPVLVIIPLLALIPSLLWYLLVLYRSGQTQGYSVAGEGLRIVGLLVVVASAYRRPDRIELIAGLFLGLVAIVPCVERIALTPLGNFYGELSAMGKLAHWGLAMMRILAVPVAYFVIARMPELQRRAREYVQMRRHSPSEAFEQPECEVGE
jgi:uncharacterized membrane protein